MPRTDRKVTAGVDTHGASHHAAVLDEVGRELGDQEFPATASGYRRLLEWVNRFGELAAIGVEGTGSYGAGLARFLSSEEVRVIEIDRPDRKDRRANGKTDPLDAYAAARAVLAGRARGIPKTRTGTVESIRMLRMVRSSAMKARTAAINEFHALLVTAPEQLRETFRSLTSHRQMQRAAALRPDTNNAADPAQSVKIALKRLAARVHGLTNEITDADQQLDRLVQTIAPSTTALFGAGTHTSGQLLITAGDNPDRLRSEAAFAHLTGVAPIPASSGQTRRHRLNRGGDRQANSALYRIVIVRMRHHQPTRDYVTRRTTEGLSKPEIIRCLKRHVAREVYSALIADLAATTT
jgi:transposase